LIDSFTEDRQSRSSRFNGGSFQLRHFNQSEGNSKDQIHPALEVRLCVGGSTGSARFLRFSFLLAHCSTSAIELALHIFSAPPFTGSAQACIAGSGSFPYRLSQHFPFGRAAGRRGLILFFCIRMLVRVSVHGMQGVWEGHGLNVRFFVPAVQATKSHVKGQHRCFIRRDPCHRRMSVVYAPSVIGSETRGNQPCRAAG